MNDRLLVQGQTLQKVWLKLLTNLIYHHEHKTDPRGFATREIPGMVFRIEDLRSNIIEHPIRNLNYKFMVAEFLWIAYGLDDLKTLTQYNGQMGRFSDDGVKLAGAYGPRLLKQWDYVIDKLRKSPNSRQSVASIWTPCPPESKDIPCTISCQYLIREDKLNTIVTMRSSDVWLGIPYDVYTFSQLANALAGELNVDTGWVQFQLGSSHIYESDVEKATKVLLQAENGQPVKSPRLPGWPENKWLKKTLEGPTCQYILDDPWSFYSSVLLAENWTSARQILTEAAR